MTTKKPVTIDDIPVMKGAEVKEAVTETISSVEVAEMMEIRHDSLIRKIESIGKDLGNHKIVVANYWTEGTYTDVQNKERKCYNVTKLGCEFLAHKTNGTKGNLFTARYMDRFEELKEALEINSYQIADPIERAKKWIEEEMVRQAQAKQIEERKPKVEYHDKVLKSDKLISSTEVAKDIGLKSAIKLHNTLHDKKVLHKKGKTWMPYSKYEWLIPDYRDYHISEFGQTLKWTEKGRKWLINFLKEGETND